MKLSIDKGGYIIINLNRVSSRKRDHRIVHRLVAQAFIPNPENKREVNHIDGNKQNNRVENLEWVTRSENQKHAFQLGLDKPKRGELNGHSKLTTNDVLVIKELINQGVKQNFIAKMFNVAKTTICDIKKKRSWAHI